MTDVHGNGPPPPHPSTCHVPPPMSSSQALRTVERVGELLNALAFCAVAAASGLWAALLGVTAMQPAATATATAATAAAAGGGGAATLGPSAGGLAVAVAISFAAVALLLLAR